MRLDGFMLAVKLSAVGGVMVLAENLLGFSVAEWIVSSLVYYGLLLFTLGRLGFLGSEKVGDL